MSQKSTKSNSYKGPTGKFEFMQQCTESRIRAASATPLSTSEHLDIFPRYSERSQRLIHGFLTLSHHTT